MSLLRRVRCRWRGTHREIVRHPLGGFVCSCGAVGADLDDMGYGVGAGWVPPLRRVFSRERHELSRTAAFEPGRRGW